MPICFKYRKYYVPGISARKMSSVQSWPELKKTRASTDAPVEINERTTVKRAHVIDHLVRLNAASTLRMRRAQCDQCLSVGIPSTGISFFGKNFRMSTALP